MEFQSKPSAAPYSLFAISSHQSGMPLALRSLPVIGLASAGPSPSHISDTRFAKAPPSGSRSLTPLYRFQKL